jgi:flagellar assembly protein FliH
MVIDRQDAKSAKGRQEGGTLFSFADLEREAREIMARAQSQANRLLSDAEADAQRIALKRHAEGYQRGLTEGRRRGLEEVRREARQTALQAAQAELNDLARALGTGLAEYERQRHSLIAQAESALIELAVAIARRACKIQVTASVEPVRANIQALLKMVAPRADCELRVSPADHERLTQVMPELLQRTAEFTHVTLKPDPAVAAGGCILQARGGVLDASVDGQLDRIAAAIGAGSA